jgi:dihydroorotase
MPKLVNARLSLDAANSHYTIEFRAGRLVGITPQIQKIEHVKTKLLDCPDLSSLSSSGNDAGDESGVLDVAGDLLLPAAIDMHIHSREPGLTHKEDWSTVARGAWAGGVVCVGDMPNTKPPTMTREAVLEKAECARRSGLGFQFWLGVGQSNVAQIAGLLADPDLPLAGLKVFYGQSTGDLMFADLDALEKHLPKSGLAREKVIIFHSEDQCAIDHNAEALRRKHGDLAAESFDFSLHSKVRSSASAHASTKIILDWAHKSGRRVHIAHVSTPEEIEMIAEFKAKGARVTGEVAPHHLLFSIDDYETLGPWIKINPPVRSEAERERLCRLVGQGLVDAFATDHAPHTKEEKSLPLGRCPSGAPALEFFWPLLVQIVGMTGLDWAHAQRMATTAPAHLMGLESRDYGLTAGAKLNLSVARVESHKVSDAKIMSKCGWSPYRELPIKIVGTWQNGDRKFLAD